MPMGGEGVESFIRIASGQVFACGLVKEVIMSQISGRDERRLGEVDMVATGQTLGYGQLCATHLFIRLSHSRVVNLFRRRRWDGSWFMARSPWQGALLAVDLIITDFHPLLWSVSRPV